MEAIEYTLRPASPIKAYQFTVQHGDDFVKMLWEWNYLTRIAGSVLVFQPAGGVGQDAVTTHRLYHGDYLIEHTDDPGWRLEVVTQRDFEDRYVVHIPIGVK